MTYHPAANWTQTDWYIDAIAGDDANDGASPATPVRTWLGGIVTRWGTNAPPYRVSVTFHIVGDLDPTDAIALDWTPAVAGITCTIVGTRTIVTSGVISGLVAKNPAANQALEIDDAASTAWMLLHNTTKGTWSVRAAAGGPGRVSLGQPNDLAGVSDDTWANGDGIDWITRSTVKIAFLRAAPQHGFAFKLQDLHVSGYTLTELGEGSQLVNVTLPDGLANSATGQMSAFNSVCVGVTTAAIGKESIWYDGVLQHCEFSSGVNAYYLGTCESFLSDDEYDRRTPFSGYIAAASSVRLSRGVWTSVAANPVYGPGSVNVLEYCTWLVISPSTWATSVFATISVAATSNTGNTFDAVSGAWAAGIAITAATIDATGTILVPALYVKLSIL